MQADEAESPSVRFGPTPDRVMASSLAPGSATSSSAKPAVSKAPKAIVKHSSFSSSLPNDIELLRKLKQTIASGAHPEFSAIIKPTAQKAVTVTREEADHQWELAHGEGLSGAEASEASRVKREEEEAKCRVAEEVIRLEKQKIEDERRRVEQEAKDAQLRARAETAKMVLEAKEADRLRRLEEARRIQEQYRKRKKVEEEAEKAYLLRQAPLYQTPVPAPPAVASVNSQPVRVASPASWDPRGAANSDRISLAGMSKGTPPPPPNSSIVSPSVVGGLQPAPTAASAPLPGWAQLAPPDARHGAPQLVPVPAPPSIVPPTPVKTGAETKRESAWEPRGEDNNKRVRLGDLPRASPAPVTSPSASQETQSIEIGEKQTRHSNVEMSSAPELARSTLLDSPRQTCNTGSLDSFDPEADEVDALIGLLPDAPPSPPVEPAPEEMSGSEPSLTLVADQPPPSRAAIDERISFANLPPSTKYSLLDRIDVSTVKGAALAASPSAALSDGSFAASTSALTVANLPSLLSRISNFIPFVKMGETERHPAASAASDVTRLTIDSTSDEPHATSLHDRLEPHVIVARPIAEAADPPPLLKRIADLPISAAESKSSKSASSARPASPTTPISLPGRPPGPSPAPRPGDEATGHASATRPDPRSKPMRSDKTSSPEQERQVSRPERKMSESALRRQQAAERARLKREEEAKRYLQGKNEKDRQAPSTAVPLVSRLTDPTPPARRPSIEPATQGWDRPVYDRSLAREPERPSYPPHPPRQTSPPRREIHASLNRPPSPSQDRYNRPPLQVDDRHFPYVPVPTQPLPPHRAAPPGLYRDEGRPPPPLQHYAPPPHPTWPGQPPPPTLPSYAAYGAAYDPPYGYAPPPPPPTGRPDYGSRLPVYRPPPPPPPSAGRSWEREPHPPADMYDRARNYRDQPPAHWQR